jgi:PEP-CTERM motif
MKNYKRTLRRIVYGVSAVLLLLLMASLASPAFADTCVGNCGTLGANGVVPLSPTGNSSYQFVSTNLGLNGVGALPTGALGSETNGSTFTTSLFSAAAGDPLNFYFNYTSSDGAGFADYAWAGLFDSSNGLVALLFTARTTPSGDAVPGFGVPLPVATLTPSTVAINDGATTWSPLGGSSGACFDGVGQGCGSTGWVLSNYTIANSGSYFLEVGVVNWIDTEFDSGLALDGITVAGAPIEPPTTTPEPASIVMLASGMVAAGAFRRKIAGK